MENIKVKCIDHNMAYGLEKEINKFLEFNNIEVIDIKFSCSNSGTGTAELYSCLIIYKEKNK